MSAPSEASPTAEQATSPIMANHDPGARGWGRRIAVFGAKLALAIGLIVWLRRSGTLDFSALTVLVARPSLFVANLLAWLACSVVLATARWRLLLRIAGVELPLARATGLQTMAIFLNVVVPGNVGGDVVKALYVARETKSESRAPLLLLVLVERVLGLLGLVFIAAIAALLHAQSLSTHPGTRPLVVALLALAAGGIVGPLLLVLAVRRYGEGLEARIGSGTRFARVLRQLVAATRLVVSRPGLLFGALLVSMSMHGVAMALFTLLTRAIGGHAVDYGAVATVFPIGLLTTVLPISPAGMGVGHVAFERLYHLVGLSGGATIFNVFLVGQIVPCAVGLVPYLLLRVRATVPEA